MLRRSLLGAVAVLALSAGMSNAKTFYWISHGGPADPVWTYFLQGADAWAKETGNTVKTSFFSGDVPSQQEAVRSAIAAKADGICSTSPDPGSMVDVVKEARDTGHSCIFIAHNIHHVFQVVDRIAVMRLGTVVADDIDPKKTSVEQVERIITGMEHV